LINPIAATAFNPKVKCAGDDMDFECENNGVCDEKTNAYCRCTIAFYGRQCHLRRYQPQSIAGKWSLKTADSSHKDPDADSTLVEGDGGRFDIDAPVMKNSNDSQSYSSERDYGIEDSDDHTDGDIDRTSIVVPWYYSDVSLAILTTLAFCCLFYCLYKTCCGNDNAMTPFRIQITKSFDQIVKMA